MKWKDFRSWMNAYFNDEDDIRFTVTNEELNEGVYPVITIITPEESEDDGGYPIMVASDLEEKEEGYFVWSHEDIANFIKTNKENKQ